MLVGEEAGVPPPALDLGVLLAHPPHSHLVQGLGFGVRGLGFVVKGLDFGVQGLGFRVRGLGFGVWGLDFRV